MSAFAGARLIGFIVSTANPSVFAPLYGANQRFADAALEDRAHEENDPLATQAQELYDALACPKTLVHFAAADGAGDHCAMPARSLFHQRMFDWLDDVLK